MNTSSAPVPRFGIAEAGALIVVAVLAAYASSFGGPFVYDDGPAIVDNATLHHFATAFFPPAGTTMSGRPLVNLSFALNHAISGSAVWSYHALNLIIHAAASLVLFGLVCQTLSTLKVQPASAVAGVAALLWTIHPLQTEAVTYVVQRAESLMGLCYLLTLYGFIRGATAPAAKLWLGLSFGACLAGMASKEVMVSAPVVVLLFDRTFCAGSFRAALTRRKRYYAALAGTWVLLVFLVASTGGDRNGTAGLDVGIPWWAYWLTQFRAITHYLALSFWPSPLIFEYGTFWEKDPAAVVPYVLLLAGLLGATLWALWRRPALGFLGTWFFVMLAPTSLVPGTTQIIVEHRMYLSLAAVVVLAVVAFHTWVGPRSLVVLGGAAVALAGLTFQRNVDYRTEVSLWGDTTAKRPTNSLAHCNLAIALVKQGRFAEAMVNYEQSLAIADHTPSTHYNYAVLLERLGRIDEAMAHYEQALRLKPDFASAQSNLGTQLFLHDRAAEAISHLEAALRLRPDDGDTECTLANALYQVGRGPAALEHYARALTLQPANPEFHYNVANTLLLLGRTDEAIAHYELALRTRPGDADTHYNLGLAFAQTNRWAEAAVQWETTLAFRPDFAAARSHLDQVPPALSNNRPASPR